MMLEVSTDEAIFQVHDAVQPGVDTTDVSPNAVKNTKDTQISAAESTRNTLRNLLDQEGQNLPEASLSYQLDWAVDHLSGADALTQAANEQLTHFVRQEDYFSVVNRLLSPQYRSISIPAFQSTEVIGRLYEEAEAKGNFFQMRRIAEQMARAGESGIKAALPFSPDDSKYNTGWEARDLNLLDQDIDAACKSWEEARDLPDFNWELHQLIGMLKDEIFISSGYRNLDITNPHYAKILKAYCDQLVQRGIPDAALSLAHQFRLPATSIAEYRKLVRNPAQIMENMKQRFQKIIDLLPS